MKIIDYTELSTIGYSILVDCFWRTQQYNKVIEYGKEWERKFRNEEPTLYSSKIMLMLASAIGNDNPREAIIYREKLLRIDEKLGLDLGSDYAGLALEYIGTENWDMVITYSKKALTCMFDTYKTSENEIRTKGINNEEIGRCLYFYSLALNQKNNDINAGDYILL